MPSTSVYLVLFSLSALIAAYLMLSGVGRSGSPADRSMMSRPLAFSSRALVDMPMVWDGWMRLMLSAKKPMGCLDSGPIRLAGREARGTYARWRPSQGQKAVASSFRADSSPCIMTADRSREPMTHATEPSHHHRRPGVALRAQGAGRLRDEGRALSARPDRAVLRRRAVQRAQSAAAHPRLHRRGGLRLRQHGDLRVPGGALSLPGAAAARARPSAPGPAGSRSSPTRVSATSSSGASSTRP